MSMSNVDDEYTNTGLLKKALMQIGYEAEDILIQEVPHMRFSKDGEVRWFTTVTPAVAYPTTNAAIRNLSRNKALANDFVAQLGFNTPKGLEIKSMDTLNTAEELLSSYKKLIVKPQLGSLSRGLTLNITTNEQLKNAVKNLLDGEDLAAIVQQQVHGDEIRFVVIGGQLKAAILRQTPRVVGDGVRQISQLIEYENQLRSKIQSGAVEYPILTEPLIDASFLDSDVVPALGEVVELGKGTMIRSGASIYDITHKVHESYRQIVENIAGSIAAQFIVIDIIVADFTHEANSSNYWFIEFNTSPVLRLFYACRDGNHFDAATYLAEMIDSVTTYTK